MIARHGKIRTHTLTHTHTKRNQVSHVEHLFHRDADHHCMLSWHPEIYHKHHTISHKLHVAKKGVEDSAFLQERPRKDACAHKEASPKKIVDYIDVECCDRALMVPPDFICWISKRVMKDPVVVASGISYEKANIQAWLDRGKTCCPRTGVPLAHLQLVPNLTLKNLIASWLASHSGLFLLKAPCTHSSLSSSSDSSVSCLNLGASPDIHHHTTSLLPKLLQNVGFSLSSTDSSPPGSPRSSISDSYLEDKSCCENEVNSHWQHEANSMFSDHKLVSKLVPERPRKEDPMLKDHLRHKRDGLLRCPVYIVPRISTLVTRIQCGHIDMQRRSVTELRILAKHDDNNRIMIANAGALGPLLKLLRSRDEAIQQEATTALLNLSLNHTVRDDAVKAGVIEPLIRIVKEGMSAVAMENAAVALTNISCNVENKAKVGEVGAIPPLLELLDNGSSRGKKDAAAALYSLTCIDENKKRMVRAGATRVLVSFICEEGEDTNRRDGMEEKALAILGNLVHVEEGRVAFVEEGGIKPLLQVMQTGSSKSKNLGISILYQLCSNSTRHRALVLQREPLPLLMNLSKSGNFRVKAEIDEVLHVLMEPRRMNHM